MCHRDLADLNNDGRLTRDGFAVAMHLIQAKLAGKDIPARLPPTLVPPSMRVNAAAVSPPPQPQQHVSDAIKDLLWDDTPAPSAAPPQQVSMVPQRTGPISPQHTAQPQSTVFGGTDPFGSSSSAFGSSLGEWDKVLNPFLTARLIVKV